LIRKRKALPKEAEDPESPRYMVKWEQPLNFPVDVPENGQALEFSVRYWCAHGCGNHFWGALRVRKVNHELMFSRDRCPACSSEGTSPWVTSGSITTDEDLMLRHSAEAIKLALAEQG
jgi:hypothetical protein